MLSNNLWWLYIFTTYLMNLNLKILTWKKYLNNLVKIWGLAPCRNCAQSAFLGDGINFEENLISNIIFFKETNGKQTISHISKQKSLGPCRTYVCWSQHRKRSNRQQLARTLLSHIRFVWYLHRMSNQIDIDWSSHMFQSEWSMCDLVQWNCSLYFLL